MNNSPTPSKSAQEQTKENVLNFPVVSSRSDSFIEEINVLRVEGRYFCFDGREAGRRKAGVYEYENSDGRKITIEISRFGHPSILAYRILQSLFRHITLEGKPYPNRVVFTKREIGRLIGREVFGGRDSNEIRNALRQLKDTQITLSGKMSDKFDFEDSFSILSRVVLIKERAEHNLNRHGTLNAMAVEMNPAIMESIRKGHIALFNWGILESLEPVQAALYKRLYLHFSNLVDMGKATEKTVIFEKSYEAICSEWLGGLSPQKYKSDILRQLLPHLESLIKCGLIRSYAVEGMKGSGYKIIFRAGKGFALDYEQFYRLKNVRQLQFKNTNDAIDYHEPIEVVLSFFKQLRGVSCSEDSIEKAELEYARELIGKFGKDDTLAFVTFGLERAERTKFKIETFRGLKIYVSAWEASQTTRLKMIEEQREKAAREKKDHLEKSYRDLEKKHINRWLSLLTEEEKNSLQKSAEEYVINTYGKGVTFNFMVIARIHKMVLEKAPIPCFEDWVASLK